MVWASRDYRVSDGKGPEWGCRRMPRELAGVDHYRAGGLLLGGSGTSGRRLHGRPRR